MACSWLWVYPEYRVFFGERLSNEDLREVVKAELACHDRAAALQRTAKMEKLKTK